MSHYVALKVEKVEKKLITEGIMLTCIKQVSYLTFAFLSCSGFLCKNIFLPFPIQPDKKDLGHVKLISKGVNLLITSCLSAF